MNSFSAVKIRLRNSWMWGIDRKTCSPINFYPSETSYPWKWYKLQTQSQSCSFPVTQRNVCSQYFCFNGFNIDVLVTIENTPFQLEDKFWNNFKITGRILFNSMYYLTSYIYIICAGRSSFSSPSHLQRLPSPHKSSSCIHDFSFAIHWFLKWTIQRTVSKDVSSGI